MKLDSDYHRFRRIFCLRNIWRTCWIIACLIFVFYSEENWRGHRAWTTYVREKTAQGMHVEWESCIPQRVPDADNFAMTPLLAALYDFKPGTQQARDTKASGRIDQLIDGVYSSKLDFKDRDWMQGEHISLSRCFTNYIEVNAPKPLSLEMAKRYGLNLDQRQIDSQASKRTNSYFQDPALAEIVNRYSKMSTKEQAQEILKILAPLNPVWDELRTAMKRPYCRYPVKYECKPVSGIIYPHLSIINKLSSILRLSAICHLALEETEVALADLELGFYLSSSLKTDPLLLSYYTRCGSDHLLTQGIWEGTSRHLWSAAQLERLQKLRTSGNEIVEARRILHNERAIGNRTIEEVRKNFKIDWTVIGGNAPLEGIEYNLYFACAPAGWFEWEKINLCRKYDEFVPSIFIVSAGRVSTKECSRIHAWWESSSRYHPYWHHCFSADLLSPPLKNLAGRVSAQQTRVDLAYLGCALERYRLDKNACPTNLSELVPRYIEKVPIDVLTGEPYRYRLTGKDQFVLYSIGIDGKDDGGTARYDPIHQSPVYDGDWIWRGEPAR